MRVKLQAVGGNALQAELGLKQWPVGGIIILACSLTMVNVANTKD